MTGPAPIHSQASLPALPSHLQSDTHLTAHLASRYAPHNKVRGNRTLTADRFHVALPVSRLSSQALVSVNTYTTSTKGPDGGKAGSAMGEAEDLAGRAWARLGGRGEDQAIVFLLEPLPGGR